MCGGGGGGGNDRAQQRRHEEQRAGARGDAAPPAAPRRCRPVQLVQRAYAHGLDGGALEGLHGQTEALRLSLMVGRLPELRALGCVAVGAR